MLFLSRCLLGLGMPSLKQTWIPALLPTRHAQTRSELVQDRLTGTFVPGSRLAAWPFHLLLNARIAARRARSSEPLVQRIQDGWYISGWPHRADVLPDEKELAVIDCTSEYPRRHDRPYLCLPTWDTQGAPRAELKAQRV